MGFITERYTLLKVKNTLPWPRMGTLPRLSSAWTRIQTQQGTCWDAGEPCGEAHSGRP